MSGSGIETAGSNGTLKEFKIERDTEIFVLPSDINIENLDKIDEANIDLEKNFKLDAGKLNITLKTNTFGVKDKKPILDIIKGNIKKASIGNKVFKEDDLEILACQIRNIRGYVK